MTLNELKSKVKEFEKRAGFDNTDVKQLLEMFDEELKILNGNLDNKKIVNHELMDLQVLILQLANRFDTDLDQEWKKHFEKSKKYLK
jgi:2-C-methyl-D-erythritol 4-phosphate cytidylyltransferase